MGYTETSWNKESEDALKPWSSIKDWADLTNNEQTAARVLGYTETSWDNLSGNEPQPVSYYKYWDELTKCGDGKDILFTHPEWSFT